MEIPEYDQDRIAAAAGRNGKVMDRHKVGTYIAQKAAQIIARNGYATARSLSLDIPCHPRTADRVVAFLKGTGNYLKHGYGIVHKDSATKIPPHSATKIPPHSATPKESTTYEDSATSDHSATFRHIPPSQLLNYSKTVQNEGGPRLGGSVSSGAATDRVGFGPGTEADVKTGESSPIGGPSGRQEDVDATAAPPLALRAADDDQQQPWGPDENEQASLDYRELLIRQHRTTEITGVGEAGAQHHSICDGGIGEDMAAYHLDLDKLIGILSAERDAWKLNNRQLGKACGEHKITRSELRKAKKDQSELRRVIVGLTEDRESGELRYYNLQAAGETLDIVWPEWRQKMAMDPDLIKHYEDMMARESREARKAAWEAKRHAAQDRQDEIAATKPAADQEPAAIVDDSDPEWDAQLKEAQEREAAALARPSVYVTQEPTSPAPAVEAATEPADIFDDLFGGIPHSDALEEPATPAPAPEVVAQPSVIPAPPVEPPIQPIVYGQPAPPTRSVVVARIRAIRAVLTTELKHCGDIAALTGLKIQDVAAVIDELLLDPDVHRKTIPPDNRYYLYITKGASPAPTINQNDDRSDEWPD